MVLAIEISAEPEAIVAVPIVVLDAVWADMVAERSSLLEAITSPPVVKRSKLAEPVAMVDEPTARVPETVAVLVSRLLAKRVPVIIRSPLITTLPSG